MKKLLLGTEAGVLELAPGGEPKQTEGPGNAPFLATAGDRAFAVTREGALWERNGGWKLVNEHAVADEVWSFGVDPRVPGRLYLGVSPALLYVSNDGGKTWKACDSMRRIPGYETWTFPPSPHIPHVRSIAMDPSQAGAIYVGVEEGGVYRTADEGVTWESLNEGLYWDVHTVLPASHSGRLYATTGNGFHRSDNGGRTWRHWMQGLDRSYTIPCAEAPNQPDLLFTAAAATPPPGWRASGTANAAIYRSEDGGARWEPLSKGLPQRFDVMVQRILCTSDGIVYAAAGPELYASDDLGGTWRLMAGELPPIRAVAAID